MYKVIIGVVSVFLLFLAVSFFIASPEVEYVANVDEQITELESELVLIEAQVQAGTLSPEAAAIAQAKIFTRLDSIQASVDGKADVKLSDAQRAMLVAGLDRLKDVLVQYKSTLVAVDQEVLKLPESERPKAKGSNRGKNLATIVDETIEVVEEHVEEVVDDYVAPEEDEMEEGTEDMENSTEDENTDGEEVTEEEVEDEGSEEEVENEGSEDESVIMEDEDTTEVEVTGETNTEIEPEN